MSGDELSTLLTELVDAESGDAVPGRVAVRRRVRRQRLGNAALATAAAVAVAVGVGALVQAPAERELVTGPTETSTTQPTPEVTAAPQTPSTRQSGWVKLPAPFPLSPRAGAATVWTGEELVVYGGAKFVSDNVSEGLNDGAALNPATGQWRRLPASLLAADGEFTSGAWTGTEVLVWNRHGAASWNPTTDEWRQHPGYPAGAPHAVWTGTRLKAWEQELSYRPADGDVVPLAPFPSTDRVETAVWTTQGVVVTTSPPPAEFRGPGRGEPGSWWRLDVGGERWQQLPAPRAPEGDPRWTDLPNPQFLQPRLTRMVWDGRRLLAVDIDGNAAAFDPAGGIWAVLPLLPVPGCTAYPEPHHVRGRTVVALCGGLAVLDDNDRWVPYAAASGTIAVTGDSAIALGDEGVRQLDLTRPPTMLSLHTSVVELPAGYRFVVAETDWSRGVGVTVLVVADADGNRCRISDVDTPTVSCDRPEQVDDVVIRPRS